MNAFLGAIFAVGFAVLIIYALANFVKAMQKRNAQNVKKEDIKAFIRGAIYVIAPIWVIIAWIIYLGGNPEAAPQQAAAAGMVLANMVFPYIIFRITHGFSMLRQQQRIIELLETNSKNPE